MRTSVLFEWLRMIGIMEFTQQVSCSAGSNSYKNNKLKRKIIERAALLFLYEMELIGSPLFCSLSAQSSWLSSLIIYAHMCHNSLTAGDKTLKHWFVVGLGFDQLILSVLKCRNEVQNINISPLQRVIMKNQSKCIF